MVYDVIVAAVWNQNSLCMHGGHKMPPPPPPHRAYTAQGKGEGGE